MKEIWLKIITRAWEDSAFKARLLTDTDGVLKEYNVEIPDGITYQAVEDQAVGKRYLVLPPEPGTPLIGNFDRDATSGDPGF